MTRPRVVRDPLELIGSTPLVRLGSASERAGAEIYGKCEFLNPTGSVKDRAALAIVEEAERHGEIEPGGTLVEATAGNTGIGLALVAALKGYRCILVIPETMGEEKIQRARHLGAEVRLVPDAVDNDVNHYKHVAQRLPAKLSNAIYTNQFDNPDNVEAHATTTGPEIWEQTDHEVDAVVLGAGTGGTVTGVGRFLKERRSGVKVVVADPPGSIVHSWVTRGRPLAAGSSVIEGVGMSRPNACFDRDVVDEVMRLTDQEAVDETWRLMRDEGLWVGPSSGLSVAAAIRWGRRHPGSTVVSFLCDTGDRYASRIFDPGWLRANGLRAPSVVASRRQLCGC